MLITVCLSSLGSLCLASLVSECRCTVGKVLIQPMVIIRVVVCMVCLILGWWFERMGDHIGNAWDITDLMYSL